MNKIIYKYSKSFDKKLAIWLMNKECTIKVEVGECFVNSSDVLNMDALR